MARPVDLLAIKKSALYIVFLIWLQLRQTISFKTMTPKVLLRNFILPALRKGKYPNLIWYDSERKLFVIKKRHAGNTNYSSDFDKIYKDWETATPRKKTNTDMKRRLFEALKRSPSFEEVEDLSTKEDRVYRCIPPTETRRVRRSTPKSRDLAPSIQCASPSFSELAQVSEASSMEDTDQQSPASSVGEPLQWLVVSILPNGTQAIDAVETFQQIDPASAAVMPYFHNWTLEGHLLPAECQVFLEEAESTNGNTSERGDSMDLCYSDTVALADHSLYLPDNGQKEMLLPDNSLAIRPSVDLQGDGDFCKICDVSGLSNTGSPEEYLEEPEQNPPTISSEEDLKNLAILLPPEELLDFSSEFPVDSGCGIISGTYVPDELDNLDLDNNLDLLEYFEEYRNSASQPLRQEQSQDDALRCQDLGLLPDGRVLDSFMDFEETLNQ